MTYFSAAVLLTVTVMLIEVVTSFAGSRHRMLHPSPHHRDSDRDRERSLQPLSAELRLLIQGTTNAYTSVRSGDVLSFKLDEATGGAAVAAAGDKKTLRLGALTASGDIVPLCNRVEGGSEFYPDPTIKCLLSAETMKADGKLCRVISSDRRGDAYVIEEYLDDSFFIPVIGANGSSEKDEELEVAQLELDIAEKKLQLLKRRQGSGSMSVVKCSKAPNPVGPYSQGIKSNGMVYASGCIGLDPVSGKLVEGGVESETVQALKNLQAILTEANTDINNIVKTTIFVVDLKQYAKVNKIYAEFLKENAVFPARTTVEVSALPLGAQVEIEAIAVNK